MAKANKSPAYEPFPGAVKLALLRKNNARMAAIELTDGKTCLVSPLAGLQKIDCPGQSVAHLLAPNHYHHKGLGAFHATHPHAQLCASKAASTRLEKLTGLKMKPLATLSRKLPTGFSVLEPAGLKTGEIWIRFKVGGKIGWLVTDAFCGKTMTPTSERCKSPTLLRTFPSFGIAERAVYQDWVISQIERDKPAVVIPCHGSIVADNGLPAKLTKLVQTL